MAAACVPRFAWGPCPGLLRVGARVTARGLTPAVVPVYSPWTALLLGQIARPLCSACVRGSRVAAACVSWPAWDPGPGLQCFGTGGRRAGVRVCLWWFPVLAAVWAWCWVVWAWCFSFSSFPALSGLVCEFGGCFAPEGCPWVSVACAVVPGVLLARVAGCVPVWCCAFPFLLLCNHKKIPLGNVGSAVVDSGRECRMGTVARSSRVFPGRVRQRRHRLDGSRVSCCRLVLGCCVGRAELKLRGEVPRPCMHTHMATHMRTAGLREGLTWQQLTVRVHGLPWGVAAAQLRGLQLCIGTVHAPGARSTSQRHQTAT